MYNAYYNCWITLQTALKIAASNLNCKITLVWLDSSLSVVGGIDQALNNILSLDVDPCSLFIYQERFIRAYL